MNTEERLMEASLKSTTCHDLDFATNRRVAKWSFRELVGRGLWELLSRPLMAWSPRPLWAWRRCVLRIFGAQVGNNVHIYPSVRISVPWNLIIEENSAVGDHAIIYNLGPIYIGRNATVSQNAHLCAGTHDYQRSDFPLVKLPITVGEGAWICADAFVGPGVTVHTMAIVGARAVVVRDVAASAIVAGNPARSIGIRPAPKRP